MKSHIGHCSGREPNIEETLELNSYTFVENVFQFVQFLFVCLYQDNFSLTNCLACENLNLSNVELILSIRFKFKGGCLWRRSGC